jgi:mannose-6-phosphate isomerase-like protein (cupin superfamily)
MTKMTKVIQKEWGVTRLISSGPTFEVWHASIHAGGTSSVHMHRQKDNEFYVISGALRVESIGGGARLVEGTQCTLERGEWHQFHALTDVELIETYTVSEGELLDSEDIVRAKDQEVLVG